MSARTRRSTSQICRPDYSAHSVFVAHLNSLLTSGEEEAIIDLLRNQVKHVDAIIELSNDDWMKEPDAPIPPQVLLASDVKKRNHNLYGLNTKDLELMRLSVDAITSPGLSSGRMIFSGVAAGEQTTEENQSRMFRKTSWDNEHILRCFGEGDLNGIVMLFRECLEVVNHTLVIKGEDMRWSCTNHAVKECVSGHNADKIITSSFVQSACDLGYFVRFINLMSHIHIQSPINTQQVGTGYCGKTLCWAIEMDGVKSRVLHKLQVISDMGHQQHLAPENIFLAALETGNLNLVELLGSRHANCVLKIRGEDMGYQAQTPARFGLAGLWTLDYTQELTSPLCITASHGYTECVRYLLHRRADPNAAPGGRSPLHEACTGGHDACVQLLLEHGANPNHRSDDGLTPLHFCDTKNSLRCAEILLQHGAIVNQTTEVMLDTPLHIAARLGLLGHVRLYLRCGADINAKNVDGETPLILACGGKCDDEDICVQICSLLLEKGADPEAQDQQDRRPLHHACRKAEHHLVELLLKYDADVNAADYNGVLPLSCVLQNAELYQDKRPHHTVQALLNNGARSVCPEAFGKVLRCCSGLPEVIALLYNSYLNLQVCSKWRQDVPQDVFQTHHSFYTRFFNAPGNVRSLQHLCRFTIRKHFGSQCHLFIPLLPVPTVIKDYLLLGTELL